MSKVQIGEVGELEKNSMKPCQIGDIEALLINNGDGYSVVDAKCCHYGLPLKGGVVTDGRLRCPFHGACFDVATGHVVDNPGIDSIGTYDCVVEDAKIYVQLEDEKPSTTKPMAAYDPENKTLYAIIGGGAAGGYAAQVLREEGYTGRIVVFNAEKYYGYDRPTMSKNIAAEYKPLRDPSFFADHGIEVHLETTVTSLDADAKVIETNKGESFQYDQCLIASGARPQPLAFIPGHDATNIQLLRTIDDAHAINDTIDGKRVAVVGSSFIGMEVASCIVDRAAEVTVIGMEKVPFERVLGYDVGAFLQKLHEQKGVNFKLEAIVQEFVKNEDGSCNLLKLKDGSELEADFIIIGAGVIPNTDFVKESDKINKARDRSIVCDTYLSTGADGLYAAGDIARFPYKILDGELVRIEHWGMSQIQGGIAARNMAAGKPVVECTNIPFFWTKQYGYNVRYAGHALKYEEVILDEVAEGDKPSFIAYYIHNGNVHAVCSLNKDPIAAAVVEALNAGVIITKEQIESNAGNTLNYILSQLQ